MNGDWIYYEEALTPLAQSSLSDSNAVVTSVLSANQVIGLDVVVVGNAGSYTGIKSENLMAGKSISYSQFGKHVLVP